MLVFTNLVFGFCTVVDDTVFINDHFKGVIFFCCKKEKKQDEEKKIQFIFGRAFPEEVK